MAKLKVLECFSGIGACSCALRNIGIDFEIVDAIEIDKHAIKSFNLIYNTNFQPQDICKWDKDIEVDLIMHGSPCQSFSLAGKQEGGDEGSGTQSSLMYETIRIIKKLKPEYVVWENVKNLLSKKHRHNFDKYIETLNELGYKSFYKVLDAVDYGIPQTRQRVFTVSILNYDEEFEWPKTIPLKKEVKDFLEENPDRKLFLSDEMIKYITADNEKWTGNNKESIINKKIASTINTGEGNRRCEASNYISCKLGGGGITSNHSSNTLFTETQTKMITKTGDIKRYINSDIIDKFSVYQFADISFPNGYNKANRVHNYCPTINTTTTNSSFIVKVPKYKI